MHNFFAKSVAVALLVGGLSLTGDLGWIAAKGQRIVGSADVPAGFDNTVAWAPPAPPPAVEQPRPAAPTPPPQQAAASTPDREPGGPEAVGGSFKPPVGGPTEIAWASLGTGSRVIVWLAGQTYRCLVVDFVDPATGEALLYEVATVDASGRPLTTGGPPRRVVVGRDDAGHPHGAGIVRGGLIHIAQTGIAPHAGGQWLGPIAAVALGN